ncbi:pyridoxal-dependent decarboxylase [Caldilinea sp.]|uniref:pyridoxal phosphate-dependent decarboxylase family protein n=1 Tax=Caldilinea sp. TaxID=2293560 RepID=UPI002C226226|nr:aspartate aminotransferase family protein [Anaerolineales bacterium]HQY92414.1 pyridoxal-dependent decarboxylase [Caldilinea sp.]
MNNQLTQDAQDLPRLLALTLHAASDYLATIDARPAATDFVAKAPLPLPEAGTGAAATLKLFLARYGASMPASNGPRFWGFVTGGATPAALMGDWLTSTYDLNLSSAANSTAPNIELEAIHLLRELFGLPDTFSGTFVTGATMANVVGLALGREWMGRQQGVSIAEAGLSAVPPIAVVGGEAHSSIHKALAMLGLGRASYRRAATLPGDREAVDLADLRGRLDELAGAPCIVVANAGTVNTVDFDDLQAIAALKTTYPFWLHIDAAFGAFAACAPAYCHLVAGMEQADSLTIDAHKWLNAPYDAAMIFARHRELQHAVFQNNAAYLGELREPIDFVHLGPENSRRLRALPVWFTLLAYGRDGYQAIVEANCAQAQRFAAHLATSADFVVLAPVRMNVVCFTLAGQPDAASVAAFLARLRDDGRIFLTPTVLHGVPAMRAAFSNWRTTEADLEIAWAALQASLTA